MFTVSYTAFGKDLTRLTLMNKEDVEFSLKMICPTYHNFKFGIATDEQKRKLSSPIRIITEKKITTPLGRQVNRPTFLRRYRNQHFAINHDYSRTHNVWFFEDELEFQAYHFPELTIFLIQD